MLEKIGKKNDVDFRLKLDKMEDDDYRTALDCLRRHLHVIECVLTKMCTRCLLEIISAALYFYVACICAQDSRFYRFAELIESTFTNIFLISVNLNIISGSVTGIQVCINLY